MPNITIHVFAYGEAQIISEAINFKTSVGDFKKLQAVVDDVKAQKPAQTPVKNYHAIHIFSAENATYQSAEKEGTFKTTTPLNATKLNALIAEFAVLKAAVPAQ